MILQQIETNIINLLSNILFDTGIRNIVGQNKSYISNKLLNEFLISSYILSPVSISVQEMFKAREEMLKAAVNVDYQITTFKTQLEDKKRLLETSLNNIREQAHIPLQLLKDEITKKTQELGLLQEKIQQELHDVTATSTSTVIATAAVTSTGNVTNALETQINTAKDVLKMSQSKLDTLQSQLDQNIHSTKQQLEEPILLIQQSLDKLDSLKNLAENPTVPSFVVNILKSINTDFATQFVTLFNQNIHLFETSYTDIKTCMSIVAGILAECIIKINSKFMLQQGGRYTRKKTSNRRRKIRRRNQSKSKRRRKQRIRIRRRRTRKIETNK